MNRKTRIDRSPYGRGYLAGAAGIFNIFVFFRFRVFVIAFFYKIHRLTNNGLTGLSFCLSKSPKSWNLGRLAPFIKLYGASSDLMCHHISIIDACGSKSFLTILHIGFQNI